MSSWGKVGETIKFGRARVGYALWRHWDTLYLNTLAFTPPWLAALARLAGIMAISLVEISLWRQFKEGIFLGNFRHVGPQSWDLSCNWAANAPKC